MATYTVDNKEFPSLKEAEMHVIGMFNNLAMNDVRDYDHWKPFYEAEKRFQELWEAEGHKTQWGADKYYFRYHNEKHSTEWREYYKRLDAFEESIFHLKPKREQFSSDEYFSKAKREWDRRLLNEAPKTPKT